MIKERIDAAARRQNVVIISFMFFMFCTIAFPVSAQQPTAKIQSLEGRVVVSLQGSVAVEATIGTVLSQHDSLQTFEGAKVMLEFSDGSQLELGENTNVTMLEFTQNLQTGARKSRIKLFWGRMRSWLSPGHQAPGSSYEVQTPNALAGVKFSEPDSEIIYDRETNITTAIAHKFEVLLMNLTTGEVLLIPQGNSGVVNKNAIEIFNDILSPSSDTPPPEPPSTGTLPSEEIFTEPASNGGPGWGTMAAVGLGAAAGTAGIVALVSNSENNGSNGSVNRSFSGTFVLNETVEPGVLRTVELRLSHTGQDISGERVETVVVDGCCTANGTGPVTGSVNGENALLTTTRGAGECRCAGTGIIGAYWEHGVSTGTATLTSNGNVLQYAGKNYHRK
ncbi:MAG: FecR domain-containing protein [bacterium]|nr:FecR domain-containing protein [bacterium]